MGKTTRWLKRFVAKLRTDSTPKDKRSPVESYTEKSSSIPGVRRAGDSTSSSSSAPAVRLQAPTVEAPEYGADDAREHAIAVAEASAAAAAQAALAAAQAAAAVVRLTASGRHYAAPTAHVSLGGARETRAALVIQSHFRGYLARRALRALKGLVKLQALVRGHIMRKKTAETVRSIEAMLRAQARARSLRAYDSPISSDKSPQFYHPGPRTPEKLEQTHYSKITSNTQSPMSKGPLTPEKLEQTSYSKNTSNTQSPMSKGSGSRSIINRVIIHPDKGYINSPAWSESQLDESDPQHRTYACCFTEEDYYIQTDKIVEIDTGKNLNQSIEYEEEEEDEEDEEEEDEIAFCTAENSPHFYPASSRRHIPMTPTKSDTSAASCPSGYSDCPRSYMAYTESSKAKMRSLSAPRQRPQQYNERAGLKKGPGVHQKAVSSASIRASYASKAYLGSGRLDGPGMPVRNNSKRFAIVDI